jgi:hypothetical protein
MTLRLPLLGASVKEEQWKGCNRTTFPDEDGIVDDDDGSACSSDLMICKMTIYMHFEALWFQMGWIEVR